MGEGAPGQAGGRCAVLSKESSFSEIALDEVDRLMRESIAVDKPFVRSDATKETYAV